MTRLAVEGMRAPKLAVVLVLACLAIPCGSVRLKIPKSLCGRIPFQYTCDAVPVGFKGQPLPASQEWEDVELDNGKGRSPNLCLKGEFCPYGHVTYAFGRNNYGQLGVGDRQTRNIPTPIPTAYLKVNALASGDQSNILTSEGRKELYAWGRDDHGQLGQGPTFNDTLPNRIYMGRPVLITMGGQHSLISTPPAPANMFDNDDFAGKAQEFVHYGDSSQPIAPSEACPRCTPWEQTPVPKPDDQTYKGRLCQSPPWSEGSGVPIVGVWCFIQKGGDKPCRLAVKAPFESGKDWWIHACNDLAKFSITPDPPIRLSAGAVWRKAKVQIYQPWRMSVFFKIRRCETVTQGGNGFVVVIQNHGIDPEHNPIGSTGSDMGLARSTRYSFNDGVPNSFGVEVRTVDSNGAIEIRACYGGAYTTDNSLAENARCQIAISYWKPDRLCNPLDPDTCCTDAEIRETNKCFKEDLKDEAPHELTILYSPFAMQVYLDDARYPKIKVDVDIREHVKSYECKSGPNKGKRCECNGDLVCGGVKDVKSCLEGHECEVSGMAWVGITAATGDAFCVHEVESWNFINLGQDGGVVSFGKNLYGQLGLADARDRNIGNLIVGLDGMVVAVMAAGKSHSIILTISGNVYTWGGNHFGQLGQGDTNNRLVPTKVRFLDALRTSAEIGDPCVCTRIVLNCQSMPRVDPCVFEVVHAAAGAYHSLVVVKRDNDAHEIYGWGDNSFGQLGCIEILGSVECPWVLKPPGTVGNWPTDEVLKEPCSPTNPRCTASPRKLAMFDRYGRQAMVFNFHSLEVGAFHNVLITKDCPKCPMPSLCANEKISREECDCDAGARKRTNVAKLWMLDSADCIAKDREIYTWGSNLRGQLGNNCSDSAHHDYVYKGPNHLVCPDSPIPIRLNSPRKIHLLPFYPDVFRYRPNPANPLLPIMINKPVAAIVGGFHNLLLFDDKSLLVWGSNYFGQLGLGDFRHRIYPVKNNYFSRRFLTPPNLAPRDGKGNSITTLPNKVLSAQRDVLVVSAGEQHTIVTTNCIGGGFKGPRTGELTSEWMPDGSCDCMFGWKGPDCNIQCNGGANTSCNGRGTFDRSNRRGDRRSCKEYLARKKAAEEYDNGGKCVGLLRSVFLDKKTYQGCPGSLAGEGCPSECQFCDEELYDCEPDGSCTCLAGFTGPDCALQCIPDPPKYNFMTIVGGAICECQNCWEGMYCNIPTCGNATAATQSTQPSTPDTTTNGMTARRSLATLQTRHSSSAVVRARPASWILILTCFSLAVTCFSLSRRSRP